MMRFFKGLKKSHLIILGITVLIVYSFVLVNVVGAVSNSEPGSDGDPIVAKSYVDSKINELTIKLNDLIAKNTGLTAKQSDLEKANATLNTSLAQANGKIDELSGKLDKLTADVEKLKASGGGSAVFETLELKKGQTLTCGASTELILRGGKATAIASKNGGLSDLTSGTGIDIKTSEAVPLNHLILVSRDDGRGLKVTTDKAWVLVKGPRTIK